MKIRVIKKGLPKAQYQNSQIKPNNALAPISGNPFFTASETTQMFPNTLPLLLNPKNSPWINYNMQSVPVNPQQQAPMFSVNNQGTPVVGKTPDIVPLMKFNNRYVSEPALMADRQKGYDLTQDWMNPKGNTSRKEMKAYVNEFNDEYDTKLRLPTVGPKGVKLANDVSNWSDALLATGAAVDYFGQDKKINDAKSAFRRNQFDDVALSPMFRGNYNVNTGRFRDDVTRKPNEGMFQMGGEENFANTSNMIKIRITGKPENLEYAYGGQSGYGLDLHQDARYRDMPQSKADSVSNTIQEVPRYAANIEAEKGETVYGDIDGDGGLEHMKIGGKRHTQGGTPLNVPEGSFIFSDTKKMKIKDPSVLMTFGKTYKAGGYTPAQIAKQYDINKYKAILEDPNTDPMSKLTAQLMISNYRKKLGSLATLQEEMKGFPQGIPKVAQGDQDERAVAAYGGFLPKYQTTGQVAVPATNEIIDQTFSPKTLSELSDPEFAKYQQLIDKYNTKIRKDASVINSMSQEDAKEFARLSGKFGFNRKDAQGNQAFRIIQGSTPGMTFTSSKGKKAGFFGGYSPEMYERRVVEDVLGADAVKNMNELDIRKEYFKELGVDVSNLSEDQLKNKKSLYANKNFFEKQFYPKFAEKFKSADYRTQLGDDMMIGAEHYDSYRNKVKPVPGPGKIPGFMCTGRDPQTNLPNIVPGEYVDIAERSAAGAVASREEAALQCPDTVIPGKIPPGETPKDGKPGFLTPDKLALLTAGLVPPKAYTPSVAELPYRQGDLVLEDWLSKAQQRQQTYNTSASTLGQFQPGTALASNLSFLAGQTGEGVSQDIAQVDSRNVDRANQFMNQELGRKTANDMYNASARDRRYDGMTIAKQNLDNSRRQYLKGITQASNNMFANRMYLDMINKVNPIYNVDPRSGLSFFKQGYDPTKLGSSSGSGGGNMDWASISKGYNAAKSSFPDLTVEQYMNRTVPKVSYSDTDGDGFANSSRSNMPSMYMQGLIRMYGGQIGPWTKKKKK